MQLSEMNGSLKVNSELSVLVALPSEVDKSYSEERIIMLFSSIFTFYLFFILETTFEFHGFQGFS